MTGYEIDEPDNLWEAIESQRAETSSPSRPMKRPVMIWVKRSIAAAAMIAVVISVGVHLINIKQEASRAPLRTKATDNPVSSPEIRPQNTMAHAVRDKQPSKTLIAQNILPAHGSDILLVSLSNWINQTLHIRLIAANDLESAKAKILASDFAYTSTFVFAGNTSLRDWSLLLTIKPFALTGTENPQKEMKLGKSPQPTHQMALTKLSFSIM